MSLEQFDLVWDFQPLRLAFVGSVSRLAQQVNRTDELVGTCLLPAPRPVRRVAYCQ
jgi:hypothetical protein